MGCIKYGLDSLLQVCKEINIKYYCIWLVVSRFTVFFICTIQKERERGGRRRERETLLFWKIVIHVFSRLIVSSGDKRKQCQQTYPTHQLLKPFEFSCTVSPAPIPILRLSPILLPTSDRCVCLRSTPSPIQPPAFRRVQRLPGLYIRVFFDRPITFGFTSSPPPFRGTWKYVVTNRRTLYFRACLPARFPIRNSFSCFLIYAATVRDLWEFYLSRYETRYTCMCGVGIWSVRFPGAICDRPRENCERELRREWEVWEEKMERTVRKYRR